MDRELQTPDYAAILADMEAKKGALETAITGLRAALASGALGVAGDFQVAMAPNSILPSGGRPVDLPRGAFLGMTAAPAIKLFLSTIRRKQSNKEIAQALRDGGLESAGNFDKYITSALFRLKEDGVVLRFEDGWGLSEWYNEAFRTKLGATKASNGKKPAKRSKAKRKTAAKKSGAVQPKAPTQAAEPAPEENTAFVPTGVDSSVTGFLGSKFPAGGTAKEIAPEVKASVGAVNFSLARLAKKGIVRRGEDGNFYVVKESQ